MGAPADGGASALSMLLWTGPIGIALVLLGFFIMAGFIPPPAPTLSTPETAALWAQNTGLKQLGMIVCIWGGVLYIPFTVGISFVLRRTERTPILTVAQAALGAFGTVFFSLNFLMLAMAPYRLDVDPASVQGLHDLGFAITFTAVQPFTFQYLLIGMAILRDRSPAPAFPRWIGYTNLWVGVLLVPACFIPLVKTGLLAWNGLLSFWIPVAVFVGWFFLMFWAARRAALLQRAS